MVAWQQLQSYRTVLRERGEPSTSHSHHELSTGMLSERNTHSHYFFSINKLSLYPVLAHIRGQITSQWASRPEMRGHLSQTLSVSNLSVGFMVYSFYLSQLLDQNYVHLQKGKRKWVILCSFITTPEIEIQMFWMLNCFVPWYSCTVEQVLCVFWKCVYKLWLDCSMLCLA